MRSPTVPPKFLIKQHHKAEEEEVYRAYRAHYLQHGKAPSLRAVADDLGVHYTTVMRHLDDLERAGRLRRVTHGRITVSLDFPQEQP